MHFIPLKSVLFVYFFIQLCSSATVRVLFEKCDTKGFTCTNSVEVAGKHDVKFRCNTNVTGQDVQVYLWAFNSLGTITSFTIEDCEKLQLSFTCSGENKPIQWLKLKNIGSLEIMQPNVVHNPPKMIFENITNIATLPRDTFSQVKKHFSNQGVLFQSLI